ncbi:MAG: staygreen family protein [Halobacteriota archaeon]
MQPKKLHITYAAGIGPTDPISPRHYTLTHSDITGEFFLTIGPEYNESQTRGWYTRLMRDEWLADWRDTDEGPALHVYCHVCGGFVFGSASLRNRIFRHYLPLALEAFRYGDRALFAAHPQLDNAPICLHFDATVPRYNVIERWGTPADYHHE